MSGAGSTFFSGQVQKYQADAQAAAAQAAVLSAKVTAANAALAILAKQTISQPEAETLITLYVEAM